MYQGHHPVYRGIQRHSVGPLYPYALVVIGGEAMACDLRASRYYVPRDAKFTLAEAQRTAEWLHSQEFADSPHKHPHPGDLFVWVGDTEARLQLSVVRAQPDYVAPV